MTESRTVQDSAGVYYAASGIGTAAYIVYHSQRQGGMMLFLNASDGSTLENSSGWHWISLD